MGRDARLRLFAGRLNGDRDRLVRAAHADRAVRAVRRTADRSIRGEPHAVQRLLRTGGRHGCHGGVAPVRRTARRELCARCPDGDAARRHALGPRRGVTGSRSHSGTTRGAERGDVVDDQPRSCTRAGGRRPDSRSRNVPVPCTPPVQVALSDPLSSWHRFGISFLRSRVPQTRQHTVRCNSSRREPTCLPGRARRGR